MSPALLVLLLLAVSLVLLSELTLLTCHCLSCSPVLPPTISVLVEARACMECSLLCRALCKNDLHCNNQSCYANETSKWMGRRTQKNVDKIRGYFIIGLSMCTIPFNSPFSPQNTIVAVASDGGRLSPVEVCHVATKFH